jgi:hypothetical protein
MSVPTKLKELDLEFNFAETPEGAGRAYKRIMKGLVFFPGSNL